MSPVKLMKEWWGDTVIRSAALITAIVTAVITMAHFGEVAKPYWFVMQYQFEAAMNQAKNETKNYQQGMADEFLDVKISIKEKDRNDTQAQIDRVEFELRKNPDAADSIKQLLNEQIRRYTDQLRIINLELDDLRRRQAGRRP